MKGNGMLDDYLEKCAVVGAAGKMGRGIALLLLQEMARAEVRSSGKITGKARLFLIDTNDRALAEVQFYLRAQLIRYAEKSIVALRDGYRDRKELVENHEVIADFVNGALSMVRLEKDIQQVGQAKFIFEAIVEDIEVKARVFSTLRSICADDAYFLTNTSSIPISVLERQAAWPGGLSAIISTIRRRCRSWLRSFRHLRRTTSCRAWRGNWGSDCGRPWFLPTTSRVSSATVISCGRRSSPRRWPPSWKRKSLPRRLST